MITWLPVVVVCGVLSMSSAPGGTDPVAAPAGTDPVAAPIPFGALLNEPMRRVRTLDAGLARLIENGVRRSATFAELVAAVNATDVIVYIQRVNKLAPTIAGQLMIVPVPNAQRYLRIQVLDHLSPDDTIALMGHELRHALEVAREPGVRDQKALVDLYRRIGESGGQVHSYDTREARNSGRQVRMELIG